MSEYQEYPKWIHFDHAESVLVEDEAGELAAMEVAGEEKPKRGRPAKQEAE